MVPIFPIWIASVGLFLGSVINSYILYKMSQKQKLAYFGDKVAARHLILPCYKPLFRFLSVIYLILVLTALVVSSVANSVFIDLHIVEFCSICSVILFSIPPVLLLQPSVSRTGFWRTAYVLIPWWLFLTLIWILSISAGESYAHVFTVVVSITTFVPPLVTCFCMLTGILASRMQLGSRSNRAGAEFLLCYSVVYGALMFMSTAMHMHSVSLIGLSVSVFLACQLFPVAMYRTLLADTKFWRGLGRHNKGGIVASDDSSTITLPELTMRVASSDFQCMLGDVGDLFIDFAFIQIGNLVGSGSSASVYRGSLRQTDVAVKVSTPPEVTAEELLKIRQEALLNSKLRHPCIVSFYGICIRPPQIGIVIEYCDHGNLRESLEKDIAEWTPLRRLDAALDACRAVAYLHSQGYMHRDIKPENYFVTRSWKVKLGDFGESTTIKEEAQVSDSGGRMTVLGTIAYMAPELVEGKAFYSEAIDIYALAITIWQIWTGNDPFDGVDTFSLYDMIMRGKRPPLPTGAPPGFAEIISDGWDPSAYHRTSAQGMADSLSVVVDDYRADHTRNRTASESSRSTAASESLQVLGSSSVIDDENLLSLPYSESKRPSLLRLSSALYEDGTISPVHSGRHNFRMSTGFGSDTDYDCLDNGTGSAQQSCDMNLDLDLTGYTDDELYQGYGRKSAIDIKKSNPLIPQLKGIMTIVSPKKTKAKNKVIW